jgi:nucleotide-binding universal stress UspA family protein
MKTILTPLDFSSVSDAVLAETASFAQAVGARVVLLTVVQPPQPIAEYGPLLADIAELTATGEKNAAHNLSAAQEKLQTLGLTVEVSQSVGTPMMQIAAEADRIEADYIVMGSHGHTALYELLVGSTTHGVLMRARCPVLIVPAVKARETKLHGLDRLAKFAHVE